MNIISNTNTINLDELISFSRGDKNVIHKYLKQFSSLIPGRIDSLKEQLKAEDRKRVRQILHQMSPQLQFFGIDGVVTPIRRLEHEYETMPLDELKQIVANIINKLYLATKEVDMVLNENFNH